MPSGLPSSVQFPEPRTYVRWFDLTLREFQYGRLLERAFPLVYPFRLDELAPGQKLINNATFKDLNPSAAKKHRYLAYLGLSDGFRFYVWHPFDVKTLKWDEDPPDDVPADDTAWISAQQSPMYAPTFSIWIEPDRYPALNALNMTDKTATPSVKWWAARYLFQTQEELTPTQMQQLLSGQQAWVPISFGGEF